MYPKIVLISLEGTEIETEFDLVKQSQVIKDMMENMIPNGEVKDKEFVPVSIVEAEILKKVLEWCEHYKDEEENATYTIQKWDEEFFEVEQAVVFKIITAANFLHIKKLTTIGCKIVASWMQNKTAQELATLFKMVPDYRSHETEEIRKENGWCKPL